MSVTTFVLLFVLQDAHGNMVQTRVTNFTSMAACQLVGEALRPPIVWNCEPGPPLPCQPPAVS
jgi:hypothetical protein